MNSRIISVSAAPYDGYDFPRVLDSLAAFIVDYTEPFDESAFTAEQARQYAAWLAQSGLDCYAFSSHIDLGRPGAVDVFKGRLDFAAAIGACVINTNAAARRLSDGFLRNIEPLARHTEALGLIIGLENPGDASDNLINTASDGIALIRRLGHPALRLNYDAGNTVSHRPLAGPDGVVPADDARLALPSCAYTHIKDVRVTPDGYFFTPLGQGDIDCAAILRAVALSSLNLSIEMPLRLQRGPDAQPRRRQERVPLPEIEAAVRASLHFVARQFSPSSQDAPARRRTGSADATSVLIDRPQGRRSAAVDMAGAGGIVLELIEVINANRAYLSEIDGAIGDGDHGINMSKGFSQCRERLLGEAELPGLGAALETLAMTLLEGIGGSMGPLYGSFFLALSEALDGHAEVDATLFGTALAQAVDSVESVGSAKVGDKTLIDTLVPARDAYRAALDGGADFAAALTAMVAAAERGWQSTKALQARIGRASRLGERSIGVLDAGATSCFLILRSLALSLRQRLA